jgi:hypothetical protein
MLMSFQLQMFRGDLGIRAISVVVVVHPYDEAESVVSGYQQKLVIAALRKFPLDKLRPLNLDLSLEIPF